MRLAVLLIGMIFALAAQAQDPPDDSIDSAPTAAYQAQDGADDSALRAILAEQIPRGDAPRSEQVSAWKRRLGAGRAPGERGFALRATFAAPLAQGAADPSYAALYRLLPQLPETRDEIESVAQILQAQSEHRFLGSEASRANVLRAGLERYRVILFSTHGLTPVDWPGLETPALALSWTIEGSPLLTLEDVLTLRLHADTVVLSACNTAAGDGRANEWFSGLARGFLFAGARSLLVMQWAVESESARRLVTAYFAQQGRDGATALALAQRALMDDAQVPWYGHPAFWAAYSILGDG